MMSLAGMWLGNFQQLRNSLANSCELKLFRFHSILAPKKVVSLRRCILRPTAARVEEKKQKRPKSKACNNTLNLPGTVNSSGHTSLGDSNVHVPNSVRRIGLQQNASGSTANGRGAVFIVFDTETTGFSPKNDRIIEIAFRDLSGGKNSTFQTLVRPDIHVLNTQVHGISSEMVNKAGVPRFHELIPILLQFIGSRQMDSKPVVFIAHNGRRFDIRFLSSEFHRCNTEIPADWLFMDTLLVASKLVKPDGSKLKSISLNALREHYNEHLIGPAHRAMQDVMILSRIFQLMTFDQKLTFSDIMALTLPISDLVKH